MTLWLAHGEVVKVVGKEFAPGNPPHSPGRLWLEFADGARKWRTFSEVLGDEEEKMRAVRDAPLAVSAKPNKRVAGAEYKDRLPRIRQEELSRLAALLLSCVDGWGEHDYGPQTPAEKALSRAYDMVWGAGASRFGEEGFVAMREAAARDLGVRL